MTFLKWMHDTYRIEKLGTSHEYWRVCLMLYRRCVGRNLSKLAGDIVNISKGRRCLTSTR
jgi:hypothetical protein